MINMLSLCVLCSILILSVTAVADETTRPTSNSSAPLIVLAGDSGVTTEHGWGKGFIDRVINGATCVNLSASGRSSKSYRTDKFWDKVMKSKATYILINFGGNDQAGKGPERETDPNTTYKQNISLYIDEARSIGATPIVIAPMVRRFFDAKGEIHSSLQPYVDALKVLAKEKNVSLIDLHQMSLDYFEKIGQKVCEAEYSPTAANGKLDRSHLTAKGGDVVGQLVVDELAKQVPDLAPFLKVSEK